MKRFVAGVIAAILLVSCIAFLDGGGSGRRTDGLFYKVSGIHPDATIMTVDGEKISAEEYLYWLAYDCEYLTGMAGQIDWNEVVTDDNITYADYVKDEVTDTMKTYAILRKMAKEGNVTITDEDTAALDAQRQQYIDYYGGEEGYLQQVQLLGVSEETFDTINSMYYLYARVEEAYCSGDLRPDDKTLNDFAKENELMTAKILSVSTLELDEKELDQYHNLMQGYSDKLKAADDADKLYAQFLNELGGAANADENGLTFSAGDLNPTLEKAISELQEGKVSDVIDCDGSLYVILRKPLDMDAVADRMFSQHMDDAISSAEVKYNKAVYNKVDVSQFFTDLLQARQELNASFGADSNTNSAD